MNRKSTRSAWINDGYGEGGGGVLGGVTLRLQLGQGSTGFEVSLPVNHMV